MRKLLCVMLGLSLVFTGCTGGNAPKKSTANRANTTKSRANTTNPHPRVQQIKTEGKKLNEVQPFEVKHGKTAIRSIGFLEPVDPGKAVADVQDVGKHLSYTAFFSYRVNSDGSLISLNDDEALAATRKAGSAPMMVITNFTQGNFSPDVAYSIFTDKAASKRLIQNVLGTMKDKGYQALNIDFEHIRAEHRNLYNGFLETILPQVRQAGYKVSTALAPKTSDEKTGSWHGAHDYKRHGELADFVILMTYEWGWSGGPPMAVAPIPQVRQVLDYAVSVIPRGKIVMGAPLYGYDWTLPYVKGGPYAKRLAPEEAADLAIKKGVKVQYDNAAQAPFYKYADSGGKQHIVWFENEQSMQAKFNLVKQYGLSGVAYWELGEPFPQNWSLLEDQFIIKRL